MSTDYHIACKDCKKTLWIAQSGGSGITLYSGEPETMKLLADFLGEHEHHELIFEDWQYHDDFEEIEGEEI